MARNQVKSQTGQERYNSKARRVLIHQFRFLKIDFIDSPKKINSSEFPDYVFLDTSDGYYPNFPVIIQGNGDPWTVGNLYLTSKLQRESGYESRTFRGIADHLLDYLRFLESENLDYLYLPKNTRLKVTFRYKQRLVELRDNGKISPATARNRINAIVNFYREIIDWNIIEKNQISNPPFDDVIKKVRITSDVGTESTHKVRSHSLAITTPKKQKQSEYISDGGDLRPLTVTEQE